MHVLSNVAGCSELRSQDVQCRVVPGSGRPAGRVGSGRVGPGRVGSSVLTKLPGRIGSGPDPGGSDWVGSANLDPI